MCFHGRVIVNISPYVDFADLQSYGVLGLIDAINKFDIGRNIKFKTYAIQRIKGSIYDELRNLDIVPRSSRSKVKEIDQITSQLQLKYGRAVSKQEVADYMGITMEEYHKTVSKGTNVLISMDDNWFINDGNDNSPMSLEETLEDKGALNPSKAAERIELKKLIAQKLVSLPENEKAVLCMYYYEGCTLKDIGHLMKVTESRVSQIHTRAILRLRESLNEIKQNLN